MKQIEKENFQTLIPLTDIVDTGEQLDFGNTRSKKLEQGSLKIKVF